MNTLTHWQKILVPTDFSEDSLRAVREAARLLQLSPVEVILLHVTEPTFDGLRIHTGGLQQAARQEAGEQLEALALAHFPAARAHVTTVVKEGRAGEVICELAGALKADAVIIATHGITALKHFVLGSVTEKVVRHAPCSVLVVR